MERLEEVGDDFEVEVCATVMASISVKVLGST